MKTLLNRLFILFLFAALVVSLLWFQGFLFRHEALLADIQATPVEGLRTAGVERKELPRILVFPGTVEAVDPVTIAPRAMARILTAPPRENDAVERGAVLFTMDDAEARARLAQARAAETAARAAARQASLAHERVRRLHENKAATTRDLEAAEAAAAAAAAGVERAVQAVAEAEAFLARFRVASPVEGRVLRRLQTLGDLAIPGRPVLTLYDPSRLRLVVAVPEELAGNLEAGAGLKADFGRLGVRNLRLERVLPEGDPRSGTLTLHCRIENPEGLRPGRLGRLALEVGRRKVLLVPASAVRRLGQVESVRILAPEGDPRKAIRVNVRTGKHHGDSVEILSGLREGDTLILDR